MRAATQGCQGLVGVALHVELAVHSAQDPSVRVDDEGRPLVEERARSLDSEQTCDRPIGVRKQRVPELVLASELVLALDRVGADADPARPECLELRPDVAEMTALLGASRREGLRIEEQDHGSFLQLLGQAHGPARLRRQLEIGYQVALAHGRDPTANARCSGGERRYTAAMAAPAGSNPDWDGGTYDRIADPMARWGTSVVERLDAARVTRVLDPGCGSGRVTERIAERLDSAEIVALDASPSMLAVARRRLARFASRITFVEADLTDPLDAALGAPADAIVSTATFHWIADHDRLFANLASVVVPGGQLVAQCGGEGNLAAVHAAVGEVAGGRRFAGIWNFASAEETARRLEAAGFVAVETWLHDEPTPIDAGEPLETYLRTVILRLHLPQIPEADRAAFVRDVAARVPDATIDYVRLNIVARRGN